MTLSEANNLIAGNMIPSCGYSLKSVRIAQILVKYRRELIKQFLDFDIKYSNEDVSVTQNLACCLTEKERDGELNLTTKGGN
jgi:hypothetical protein